MAKVQLLGQGLAGKGVLLTGAASGIGKESAKLFVEYGARVLAVDVDGDGLDELAAEVKNDGATGELVPAVFDLRRVGDGTQLVARAQRELGNLYVVALVAAALRQ